VTIYPATDDMECRRQSFINVKRLNSETIMRCEGKVLHDQPDLNTLRSSIKINTNRGIINHLVLRTPYLDIHNNMLHIRRVEKYLIIVEIIRASSKTATLVN
jgi:hypothetical protein